jgi:hypothetical protein
LKSLLELGIFSTGTLKISMNEGEHERDMDSLLLEKTAVGTDGKTGGPQSSEEVARFYTPQSIINKYFCFDNGEFIIYWHQFLRQDLDKGGHQFSISNTDINGLTAQTCVNFILCSDM